MLVLLQKTLKKLLPYAKLYVSWFKFHRNVFPVVLLIMIQQWFWWFGLLSNTPLPVQSRFNLTSICRKSKHMYMLNCIVINIWCACLIWIYWPPTGIFSDNCFYDWSLATPYGVRQLVYTRKRLNACVSIWNWYKRFICRKLGVSRWKWCDITHVIWIVVWPPMLFCLPHFSSAFNAKFLIQGYGEMNQLSFLNLAITRLVRKLCEHFMPDRVNGIHRRHM